MASQKTRNKSRAKAFAVSWTDHAWDDYLWWQSQGAGFVVKINDLIEECRRDPFHGTGKPEPLKGDLTGFWSRRITQEHRLVYLPEDGGIHVVQCRFHY